MSLEEEPRLEQALRKIMKKLDQEVPKALISWRHLDAGVVSEAEESLEQPKPNSLEERRRKAREQVDSALHEWLEATADWMHHTSEPGP